MIEGFLALLLGLFLLLSGVIALIVALVTRADIRRMRDDQSSVSLQIRGLQRRIHELEYSQAQMRAAQTAAATMPLESEPVETTPANVAEVVEPEIETSPASEAIPPAFPVETPILAQEVFSSPAAEPQPSEEPIIAAMVGIESIEQSTGKTSNLAPLDAVVPARDRTTTGEQAPSPVKPKQRMPKAAPDAGPAKSWEEQLGARLPIWIGAIALALAGVFMVRYFSERGWLGPRARIGLAALGGLLSIGVAEWMRRSQPRIAQGLAAAGVAILYAALVGATTLYPNLFPWITPEVHLALVGLITAAAVGLSLRHGPAVALLGLLGGFLMPALVKSDDVNALGLFSFLFLVQLGLVIVCRQRRWWWIALLAMLASQAWATLWIVFLFNPLEAWLIGSFLLATMIVFVLTTIDREDEIADLPIETVASWGAIGIGALLTGWLLSRTEYDLTQWGFVAATSIGTMVLARLRSRYFPIVVFMAAMSLVMLAAWGILDWGSTWGYDISSDNFDYDWEGIARFIKVTFGLGAIFGIGSVLAIPGAKDERPWAVLSSVSVSLLALIAWWSLDPWIEPQMPWWAIMVTVSALFAAVATMLVRAREKLPHGYSAAVPFVTAATTLLALAVHIAQVEYEFGRQWIAVAWAVEVPVLAFLAQRWNLPKLRGLAALVAVAVGLRLLLNPFALDYDYGLTPVWNGLLYAYGVPMVLMGLASYWCAKCREPDRGQPTIATLLACLSLVFGLALVSLEVRHGFHPGKMSEGVFNLWELSTYSIAWAVVSIGLLAWGSTQKQSWFWHASKLPISLSLGMVFIFCAARFNPLLVPVELGETPVLNGLLYVYGLPALLAMLISRLLRRDEDPDWANWTFLGSMFLFWLMFTLQVRHGFYPKTMHTLALTIWELATYSTVWGAMAIGLLAYGLWRNKPWFFHAGKLPAALSLLVAVLGCVVFLSPFQKNVAVGELPVLNGLLYIYGVPAVLAAVITRLLRRDEVRAWGDISFVGSTFLFWYLTSIQVYHGFNPKNFNFVDPSVWEVATYSAVWGAMAVGLLAYGLWQKHAWFYHAGKFPGALCLVWTIFASALAVNPLWNHNAMGELHLLNGLLYLYGLPVLLLGLMAKLMARDSLPAWPRWFGGSAFVLLWLLVTLQVRHAFQGTYLDGSLPENPEWYSYSAAWIVFAGLLLAIGILRRDQVMRWASLVLMMAVVCKVFLFDTRNLEDMWRVFSYLGLGLSLFLLAWVYQRYVFGKLPANRLASIEGE